MKVDQSRYKDISKKPKRLVKCKSQRCTRCSGRGQNWWWIGSFYPDYGSGWKICSDCKGTGKLVDQENTYRRIRNGEEK